MSFTVFTNVITVLFCIAVLIQSVRMMRSLKDVRENQLDRTVGALDTATAKAQGVLSELRQTLVTDGSAHAGVLGDAREVREELNVMIGIANAMAERLMEAAASVSRHEAEAASVRAKATRPARSRTTKAAQPKADAPKAGKGANAKATTAKASGAKGSNAKPTAAKSITPKATGADPALKVAATKKAPARPSRKTSAQRTPVKEAA